MRPAILRRRSLAYPGGAKPGFDSTHPMAVGANLSAVFDNSGNFINLCPGFCPPIGTIAGTVAKKLDSQIGPAKDVGTTYKVTFTSGSGGIFSSASAAVTFAAIMRTSASDNSGIICAGTDGPQIADFGGPFYFSQSGTDTSSGITLAANTPYFVVASFEGTINFPCNFLVLNLQTGNIQTATVVIGQNVNSTGTGFSIGFEGKYTDYWQGRIAAVYAANAYHQLQDLQAWATDPWRFWYPPYPTGDIPVLSSAGTSSGTIALTGRSTAQSKGMGAFTGRTAFSGASMAQAKATDALTGKTAMVGQSTAQAMARAQSAGQTAMSAKSTAQAKAKAAPTAVVLLAGKSFAMSTGRGANNTGSTIALTATSTAMSKALASATGAVLISAKSTAQAKSLAAAAGITLFTAKSTAQSKTSAGATVTVFLSGRSTAQAKALASAKAVVALTATSAAQAKALAAGTGAVLLTGRSAAQAKAMAQIGTGNFIALAARSSAMSSAFGVPTLTFTPPPAGSQLIFAGDPREQDRLRKKKAKLREELEAEEERLERAREAHQRGIVDIVQRKGAKPPPLEALPEPEPQPIKIEPALAKALKEHSDRAQQYDDDEEESAILLLLID